MKKTSGWLIAVVALLIPVLYVISFGPACWLRIDAESPAMLPYVPLGALFHECDGWPESALRCWMTVGAFGTKSVRVPTSFNESYVSIPVRGSVTSMKELQWAAQKAERKAKR